MEPAEKQLRADAKRFRVLAAECRVLARMLSLRHEREALLTEAAIYEEKAWQAECAAEENAAWYAQS
jgi:hypothetical protein